MQQRSLNITANRHYNSIVAFLMTALQGLAKPRIHEQASAAILVPVCTSGTARVLCFEDKVLQAEYVMDCLELSLEIEMSDYLKTVGDSVVWCGISKSTLVFSKSL